MIAESVTTRAARGRRPDLLSITTRPLTGIPILILVLGAIFGLLFFIGEFLASVVSTVWGVLFSPLINTVITTLFGDGSTLSETLLWGLDAGLEAAFSIGIPYILTFYFLLAILEDSGYLNAVAFLTDRAMHRMGLHGRSIIPLVAGLGCSVPAVLAHQDASNRPRALHREHADLHDPVQCANRGHLGCGRRTSSVSGLRSESSSSRSLVTVGVGLVLNRMHAGYIHRPRDGDLPVPSAERAYRGRTSPGRSSGSSSSWRHRSWCSAAWSSASSTRPISSSMS